MSSSALAQIRDMLASTRADADRTLATAAQQARAIEDDGASEAHAAAQARLEHVAALRDQVEMHSREIESSYAEMVETLAATAMRLVEMSREADFTPPDWVGGIDRAVAIRLSETREMTVRLQRDEDEADDETSD